MVSLLSSTSQPVTATGQSREKKKMKRKTVAKSSMNEWMTSSYFAELRVLRKFIFIYDIVWRR